VIKRGHEEKGPAMKLSAIVPDSTTRNILLLSVLTLIETLQLLVVVALVFSFVPIAFDKFANDLFPLYQNSLKPEREMTFYHVAIFFGLALQAAVLYLLRRRLADADFSRTLVLWIAVESLWLFIQLYAVFKIFLYNDPAWARAVLYSAVGLSLASKIFWPEVRQWSEWIAARYQTWIQMKIVRYGFATVICLLIAAVIYVKDAERVLGMISVWGNFAQFKQWRTTGILSGADDARFLQWAMTGTVIYFGLVFAFMRAWLNSIVLAAGAVFLMMKWQLFHAGAYPVVWQYPHKLGLAYFADLGLFALLLAYVRWDKKPLFWIAAAGLSLEAGRYLWAALTGPDPMPLYAALNGKNFFAFTWQFVLPIIYALTFLIATSSRDRKDKIVAMAACLYGLAIFADHVKNSGPTSYYWHSLPLVMVFAFWTRCLCDRLGAGRAFLLRAALALVCLVSLLTSNLFMVYPNVFNMSSIQWDQVTAHYQQQHGVKKP
jgi:hypothetical protein